MNCNVEMASSSTRPAIAGSTATSPPGPINPACTRLHKWYDCRINAADIGIMEPASSCTTKIWGKITPVGYMNVPVTISNSKGRPDEAEAKGAKKMLEAVVMRRRYDLLELTRCFCPEEAVLEQYSNMHKVDSSNNDRGGDEDGSDDDDYDLDISPTDPRARGRNPKKRNYARERKLSSTLELSEQLSKRELQGRKHIDHSYSFVALAHSIHEILSESIHKHAPGLRFTVDTLTLHTTTCKQGDKTSQVGEEDAGTEEQKFAITPENWDDLRGKITDKTTREVGIEVKWSSGEIKRNGNAVSRKIQKKAVDLFTLYHEMKREWTLRRFLRRIAKDSPLALAEE